MVDIFKILVNYDWTRIKLNFFPLDSFFLLLFSRYKFVRFELILQRLSFESWQFVLKPFCSYLLYVPKLKIWKPPRITRIGATNMGNFFWKLVKRFIPMSWVAPNNKSSQDMKCGLAIKGL